MPKISKAESLKINLPGIDPAGLKELRNFIDGNLQLEIAWAVCAVTTVILAQIAYASNPRIKHQEYTTSESVSMYIKQFLANTIWSRTIYALVALRQSLGAYDLQSDPIAERERFNNDLHDLINNPKGDAATRGGIRAALTSEERTRKYRRGLMLRLSGFCCNRPLTTPGSVLSKDAAAKITIEDILKQSPFDVVSLDALKQGFTDKLSSSGLTMEFVDNFKLVSPHNLTSIERELGLVKSRQSFHLDPKEIAVNKDDLDDFQKLIWNSKKNLG